MESVNKIITTSTNSSKKKDFIEPLPYISRSGQSTTEFVNEFWQHTITVAEDSKEDFKHQALPLARIKKVMRSDPRVKMISSEVTILFEKACQIFIQELTARSHLNSLSSRRRTLSRPDVAQAIAKSDMFDFLIDIVPREEGEMIRQDLGGVDEGKVGRKTRSKGKMVLKSGKKTGRGKGKKNKLKMESTTEGEDELYEEGDEIRRKRIRLDNDDDDDDDGDGVDGNELMERLAAEDDLEEDDGLLDVGSSNASTALSPYDNVEVIDWTANDFKMN